MGQVKAAEADAESRYLSGVGVARQRKAIVAGLQASVSEFSKEVDGATPRDVMDILLLTQYFDTLNSVGANNMILEHDPSTVGNLQRQVASSFLPGHGTDDRSSEDTSSTVESIQRGVGSILQMKPASPSKTTTSRRY